MKILFALLSAVAAAAAVTSASAEVVIENARFKLVLGDDARARSLVVKATGEEMLDLTEDVPAFSVIQERPFNNEVKLVFPHRRTEFRANRVRREGGDLFVGFELVFYEAQIRLTECKPFTGLEGELPESKDLPAFTGALGAALAYLAEGEE